MAGRFVEVCEACNNATGLPPHMINDGNDFISYDFLSMLSIRMLSVLSGEFDILSRTRQHERRGVIQSFVGI